MPQIVKYETSGISLDARIEDGQAWLTYEQTAELFGVQAPAVIKHVSEIISDGELTSATTSKLEVVRTEGNRSVNRDIVHLNQDMVVAIGYRVRSDRGIEFRRYVTSVLKGEAPPMLAPKPMTSIQMLVVQAQALADLEQRQLAQEARVQQLEAHIQPEPEFYTIMAWGKICGKKHTLPEAAALGRQCALRSRESGYQVGSARDPRFGTVGQYHVDILREVIGHE